MKNRNKQYKDAIYDQFSRIGSAISSPKRLELLDLLDQGERTVETLASEAGMTVANTSRHLQVLRAARLVGAEKDGLYVRYSLADGEVSEFLRHVRMMAEKHLAEVAQLTQQFLKGREELEPVDRDALRERIRDGLVTVIDVRPVEEYLSCHIPGAVSIPLKELEERLADLPKDQDVVAYCRGPYCVLAVQAVEMLNRRGFHAIRLEDGVADWRARGLQVAVGEGEVHHSHK